MGHSIRTLWGIAWQHACDILTLPNHASPLRFAAPPRTSYGKVVPNRPAEVKKTTPWATRPAAMTSSRPQERMKNHLRLLIVRPLQGEEAGEGWKGSKSAVSPRMAAKQARGHR